MAGDQPSHDGRPRKAAASAVALSSPAGTEPTHRLAGKPSETVYGCTTSGTAWRFLNRSGSTFPTGLNECSIDVDRRPGGLAAFQLAPRASRWHFKVRHLT